MKRKELHQFDVNIAYVSETSEMVFVICVLLLFRPRVLPELFEATMFSPYLQPERAGGENSAAAADLRTQFEMMCQRPDESALVAPLL